jgi:hypothetical protein
VYCEGQVALASVVVSTSAGDPATQTPAGRAHSGAARVLLEASSLFLLLEYVEVPKNYTLATLRAYTTPITHQFVHHSDGHNWAARR